MLSESLLTTLLHPYTHARAHCTHPIITTPSSADAAAPQSSLTQHAPASITSPTWRGLFFALHLPLGSVRLGIPAASRLCLISCDHRSGQGSNTDRSILLLLLFLLLVFASCGLCGACLHLSCARCSLSLSLSAAACVTSSLAFFKAV